MSHAERCTCAYCRQSRGWVPETVVLRADDWSWVQSQGEASDVIERLIRDAQRRAA
jgi:hypothetical protein